MVERKQYYLGLFNNKEKAREVRENAEKVLLLNYARR